MPSQLLRIAIADDDKPICNLLHNLLCSFAGVEVVGTAADGNELIKLVRKTGPEAILVDVQMPGLDGLSVARQLQKEYPGLFVIFISAHTHYAVEAFNLDATDYLVKPVDETRLGRALAKIRRFRNMLSGSPRRSEVEHSTGSAVDDGTTHLVLKYGHGIALVDPSSILFIEKEGKKCIVHTTRGRYETVDSLVSLEKRLDPSVFFRCHKSFLVNVRQVDKIVPYADRAYDVYFYNYPAKVTMRRDKFEEFCSLIGGER